MNINNVFFNVENDRSQSLDEEGFEDDIKNNKKEDPEDSSEEDYEDELDLEDD